MQKRSIGQKLIKPKQIEVQDIDGNPLFFTISRLPALAGREVATQYVTSMFPKIGSYELNETLCIEMLSYTNALKGDIEVELASVELINQHTIDWEGLRALEREMIAYNTHFLVDGNDLTFSNLLPQLTEWIAEALDIKTSMELPEQ